MRFKPSILAYGIGLIAVAISAVADTKKDVEERLQSAGEVLQEIQASPDKGIPQDLIRDAHCAVIVPGLKKGGFIVGAKYGKGFVTCREGSGWSAPAAVRVEGGSVGFQIGGSETDMVLLVMNDKGAQKLMESQFTVGAEGEVAAGPVGRNATAQTDGKFRAEILSWSRSRGVFGGIALQAATLREDKENNAAMYGKELTTKEVVHTHRAVPAAAKTLLSQLTVAQTAN